ncbi:zinc transport system ATP-binding protein [Treponema bryantii]|uniref:Zinc transport system ATP-binding protein n=1 Tax=Treponema bryantii TaxID=163 RepID=A0A1H9EZG3_9SPIR|nr:DUF1893 domain-containing protein [Treponema bryantii]SEQ31062.1 zinc transport system ATP-binding protein [Treponema bryantii]
MLKIFSSDTQIFYSESKWLHPIFEFEEFLKAYDGPRTNLSAWDSAIGKAAAVLLVRLGVEQIHGELVSNLAVKYIAQTLGEGKLTWDTLVDRLMCQTESQLENLTDSDEMYYLLRQRAKLVLGIPVSIQNLSYKYGKINGLNLEVPAGGRLMILGENGTGKTTLLRLLCGIYKPDSGSILIDGKPVDKLPKYTIGYIPQLSELQEEQSFDLTAEEVVGLGINGKPEKSGGKSRRDLVEQAMRRTGCAHLAGRKFSVLSGGEKQKVSLARCLAQKARLLLLDEPTANLDKDNRRMVVDILTSLSISEIPTIIMVTHDKELTSLKKWEVLNIG